MMCGSRSSTRKAGRTNMPYLPNVNPALGCPNKGCIPVTGLKNTMKIKLRNLVL